MKKLIGIWAVLLVFGFGLVAYHMDPPPKQQQQQAQSSTECHLTPATEKFRVCESTLGSSEYVRCGLVATVQHPEWTAEMREKACAGASTEWKVWR
jgi:hypothetical protein